MPNIEAFVRGLPTLREGKGALIKVDDLYSPTVGYSGNDYARMDFDGKKTLNKNGSTDPNKWTTIDNPTYQDPINGKPVEVKTRNFTYKIWNRKF